MIFTRKRLHGIQRQMIVGPFIINQFVSDYGPLKPCVEVFRWTTGKRCQCVFCVTEETPEGWPSVEGSSIEAQTFAGPNRKELCDNAFVALCLKYETLPREEAERIAASAT